MAMGSENLRLCRRTIRVIAIVALLLAVLDGVQQQQPNAIGRLQLK